MPRRFKDQVESNLAVAFEFPTTRGAARRAHFLLGATIDLNYFFSGHGFGQFMVTF